MILDFYNPIPRLMIAEIPGSLFMKTSLLYPTPCPNITTLNGSSELEMQVYHENFTSNKFRLRHRIPEDLNTSEILVSISPLANKN